jgi:hypothetical protein
MLLTRLSKTCLTSCARTTNTTVISSTSTTTVHATAKDDSSACDKFVGACVVYGASNTPYTSTVYATGPSLTNLVTSTSTVQATGTVLDGGTCTGLYGTDGSAQYTTTAYTTTSILGNSGGYIAADGRERGDTGVIGAGSSIPVWTWTGNLVVYLAGGICAWS